MSATKVIFYFSAFMVLFFWLAYWFNFGHVNGLNISNNPSDWALLGDYLGGVLNPILSFLTIVLLISSLALQKESNAHLKSEIEKNAHNEKVRSFESIFFNMIDSQKISFNKLKLGFLEGGELVVKENSNAVINIEEIIAEAKDKNATNNQIKNALQDLDSSDEIFTVIRCFCVLVKVINHRISDAEGFSKEERLNYYETLINFTDYALIRLVLISLKYLDYQALVVLRIDEFDCILQKLGLVDYLNDI